MSVIEKRKWHSLFQGEKETYLERARWLIDKEYVSDITETELAMRIYENDRIDIPAK